MSEPLTYDDVVTALAEQQELIAVARQMIHRKLPCQVDTTKVE